MDVTKANFEHALAEIHSLLPTAAFLAFDEEMTGINLPSLCQSVGDTPQMRYGKMAKVASHFNMIQFGLAMYHRSDDEDPPPGGEQQRTRYTCRVYNFYLFPEDGMINMEARAVAFNRNHGMDWNRWIREGIPYVSRAKAKELRKGLEAGAAANRSAPSHGGESKPRMVLKKPSDVETTSKALEDLKAWLDDESRSQETEFELITTNAYLRRFMYESLALDFPTLVAESRAIQSGQSTMIVKRFLTVEQKEEWLEQKSAEKKAKVDAQLGFHRVYEALVAAKKPLIGHATMYDLLFLMAHCEGTLPECYGDFKKLVGDKFPVLFDTQFLCKHTVLRFVGGEKAGNGQDAASINRFGSMALGAIHKALSEDPLCKVPFVQFEFPAGSEHESKGYGGPDCKAFHEAGFDAYVTGCAFAMLLEIARKEAKALPSALEPNAPMDCAGRLSAFQTVFEGFDFGRPEILANREWGVCLHVSGLTGKKQPELTGAFETAMQAWDGGAAGAARSADNCPSGVSNDGAAANAGAASAAGHSAGDGSVGASGTATDHSVKFVWIDDSSAFVVLPERYRSKRQLLVDGSVQAVSPALHGLSFVSGEEWLQAGLASGQDERAECVKGNDGGQPAAKRQRVDVA